LPQFFDYYRAARPPPPHLFGYRCRALTCLLRWRGPRPARPLQLH